MVLSPQNWAANLRAVRSRIAAAAARCGRNAQSITLVGASKGHPLTAIEALAREGVCHFGESYVQEALAKIEGIARSGALADAALTWHFIGHLQANKTRPVAESFAWVHGVDRLKLAERLSAQRPHYAPPLNVCIEVNLAGEPGKAGVAPGQVRELVMAAAALPRLRVRGLMCLPPAETEEARQRGWFAQLRGLFEALNAEGAGLDTLSMGMSADLEAAVLEGATLLRVGTALFGPRPRA